MIEGVKLSDLGDEELDSRLSDALRSKTYGSQRMDEYISDMLDEVRARKMFLTEESEANLADRLAVPATARLADSGGSSIISIASAHFLWKRRPKCLPTCPKTSLRDIAKPWRKTTRGLQILDCYYAKVRIVWQRGHMADAFLTAG